MIRHRALQAGLLSFGLFVMMQVEQSPGVQAASGGRLQIGYVSFVPGGAPLWVAADGRFFAQEGLDPDLIFIGTAPTMVASLMAREVPLALTTETAVISAIAGGAPLKIVATFNNWLTRI
jgi:ABC-type nitrate/sulfonate/bicarbonate transport system substrate-binding protein